MKVCFLAAAAGSLLVHCAAWSVAPLALRPRHAGPLRRTLSSGAGPADSVVEQLASEEVEEFEVLVFACETAARLDACLGAALPHRSRTSWGDAVGSGDVRVNGVAVSRKSTPILLGDVVEATDRWRDPDGEPPVAEDIPLQVLYEDEQIIVVNKAAGMVTHPAPGNRNGTLVNALAFRYGGGAFGAASRSQRPGVVHRLDKGTSGCLVVAKTELAQAELSAAFAERRVEKVYLTVVARAPPVPPGAELVIDEPIGRHPVRRQEMAVVGDGSGKRAVSRARALASDGRRSVVQVVIETGRTHQIRVHLAHVGSPVLGDAVYGESAANRDAARRPMQAARPLLHAWKLGFAHPTTGEALEFTAPLPSDMERAVRIVSGRS